MIKKRISKAVISRLPRYYRYLEDILKSGQERISSEELSRRMGLTASQIRQDLNNFGGFGHQGYGYNVESLKGEIARILGIDTIHNIAVIGMGNIGKALVYSEDYVERGFAVKAAFDKDKDIVGEKIKDITIRHIDELEETIKEKNIEIVVICVPKMSAENVANRVISTGIKGIWNFAHVDLKVPKDIVVENVHLSDSLMQISYNIIQK